MARLHLYIGDALVQEWEFSVPGFSKLKLFENRVKNREKYCRNKIAEIIAENEDLICGLQQYELALVMESRISDVEE